MCKIFYNKSCYGPTGPWGLPRTQNPAGVGPDGLLADWSSRPRGGLPTGPSLSVPKRLV